MYRFTRKRLDSSELSNMHLSSLPLVLNAINSGQICCADVEKAYVQAAEAVIAKLRDPQAVYMLETSNKTSQDIPPPVIIRGVQLNFDADLSKIKTLAEDNDDSDTSSPSCSYFSIGRKAGSPVFSAEVTNVAMFFYLPFSFQLFGFFPIFSDSICDFVFYPVFILFLSVMYLMNIQMTTIAHFVKFSSS